jgi:DNA-binding response OmpR family regulator
MMDYQTLFSHTKDLTLLLVEDYEPLRKDMAEMLEDLFKEVVVASNGAEGLGLYNEYQVEHDRTFDIVISDIVMPVMNGVDLCEILRKQNEEQQIIILSAHTDSEYLLRLINLGIAQFINKPVQHERLLDTLMYVCNKINKEEDILPESTIFDMGEDILWYKDKDILMRDRLPVALTRHEILLMQLFVEKEGQICTNDDIIHYFYRQGVDLDEKNIRNLVFKLRKKLPSSAVSSIYGMGYKLTQSY